MADLLEPLPTARPGVLAGITRMAVAFVGLLAALFVPDRGLPPLVTAARFRLALVIVVAAAGLAAWTAASRLDVGPEVRAENAERRPATASGNGRAGAAASTSPDLAEVKTDRQIDDEIAKRTAVQQVKLGLGAALGTPFRVFMIACFLFVLGAYVGGKPTLARTMAAAAIGALPWAVHDLIAAVVTWRRAAITPGELGALVAGRLPVAVDHPLLARLIARVDLFVLWSVVLWGLGLAAAAGFSRARGLVTVAVGFTLYLLITTAGA